MAIKISGTTVIDDSRILQNVLAASSGSGAGSTLLSAGSFVASASQQGGRTYETHDFNSYPNLYSSIFINSATSSNVPAGVAGNVYRFIMGAGDTTSRGFDLLGTSSALWFRSRESGTWIRTLTSSDGSFTGRLLRAPQILTSGTSYTTPAGCTGIYVEAVGAGGGSPNVGSTSYAGGGGGGGYCAKYFTVTASTAYTYAIGAGAAAGNGGNTTFTVGATTITAVGGRTAVGTTGGRGGWAINGDLNANGSSGTSAQSTVFGAGGSSFFGAGGALPGDTANGQFPGGGASGTTIAFPQGGNGLIRVWEFA